MPRPRQPARLYYREKEGRWVIKDGGAERATGATGRDARELAEEALSEYLATRPVERVGPAHPHQITITEVLELYARERGPLLADPVRLTDAIDALAEYWGDQTCDAVKGATCRAYERHRAKPRAVTFTTRTGRKYTRDLTAGSATVRRELGVLQAALRHAQAEGKLTSAPIVTLSESGTPRERWMTRDEVAALIREIRRGSKNRKLARGILLGCYTGTRPGTVLRTRLIPTLDGPWIDAKAGVLHRRGALERETKKRRGDCLLPDNIALLARLWAASGDEWLVSYGGRSVKDVGRALELACDRAGIERITPHCWKHTAITWFFQNGGSMEDAVDFFSTTAATLASVYRKHSSRYQRRAAATMRKRPSP